MSETNDPEIQYSIDLGITEVTLQHHGEDHYELIMSKPKEVFGHKVYVRESYWMDTDSIRDLASGLLQIINLGPPMSLVKDDK